MGKLKKALLIFTSIILIIIALVIVLASPIVKYLVEKYDVEVTGREIKVDWAYANPFTGYLYFSGVKIYEQNSDGMFISANSLSGNFTMLKLLTHDYEINRCTLDHPHGVIDQNYNILNFDDVIKKFTPKPGTPKRKHKVHFSILRIKVIDGVFDYHEHQTPINYTIRYVNFESPGKRWDLDTMDIRFAFSPGTGAATGTASGDFNVNFKTNNYRVEVVAQKFDLNIIEQYFQDLSNYGCLSANVDANIRSNGNFNDEEDVTASGLLAINDFHLGKSRSDDYASFHKLVLSIIELSPKNRQYRFDSLTIAQPFFRYELYDSMDNMETMFGRMGANITAARGKGAKFNLIVEIGRYIKVLAKNFFRSDYKVGKLAINNADVKFNDFSINEQFSAELTPLFIYADSINKSNKRVKLSLRSGIKPYGHANVNLSIDTHDSSDFDMQYHIQKLPVTIFNPYVITNSSFLFDKGSLEVDGVWNVRHGNIKSQNHVLVIDPQLTRRVKNEGTSWLPLRLIMALVKERGNVIDYEIPITGSLKKPKVHYRDVIAQLIKNILIKPATLPYDLKVKTLETEIDKSITLKWGMRATSLDRKQEKYLWKMADFLSENPDASIAVSPELFGVKEKEYILYYEAKKKYYLAINHRDAKTFSPDDSINVDRMSVKDAAFARYLDKHKKDRLAFSTRDKCSGLVSVASVNSIFDRLSKERSAMFMSYFREMGVEKQVKISAAKTVVPYNGFSFYKINYKGEFPEYLAKAYRKMNDLNGQSPREKFRKKRRKLFGLF